jgi:hypothetical protein
MRKWTRMLILFLLLTLLPGIPALAEDVCTVKDAMTASCITTDRAYLRLQCEFADECPVTVTVRDAWGTLVYQRDYGIRHGAFRSSDIHLPLEGESCEYRVSLCAGDTQNTFTVIREMAMISDTAVYAGGLTLKDMVDGSRRKYAVVLDMDALNEVIAAKRRELKGNSDRAAQQKIMRHAASRGYEPSLIIKAINYDGDEMDF